MQLQGADHVTLHCFSLHPAPKFHSSFETQNQGRNKQFFKKITANQKNTKSFPEFYKHRVKIQCVLTVGGYFNMKKILYENIGVSA